MDENASPAGGAVLGTAQSALPSSSGWRGAPRAVRAMAVALWVRAALRLPVAAFA